MSVGNQKRSRAHRVSPLKLPPGLAERAWSTLRRGDVLARLAMCFAAASVIWIITGLWYPPFPFREGDVPSRDVVARVDFESEDRLASKAAKDDARAKMNAVYRNDPTKLDQTVQALRNKVFSLLGAKAYLELHKEDWLAFSTLAAASNPLSERADEVADVLLTTTLQLNGVPETPSAARTSIDQIERIAEFDRFKKAFADDRGLEKFKTTIVKSMAEIRQSGLLEKLEHKLGHGSQTKISVYESGRPDYQNSVNVDDVRIALVKTRLAETLKIELGSDELGQQVFNWLSKKLPVTLTFDPDLTRQAADNLKVAPEMITKKQGDAVASAGEPMVGSMELLKKEHNEYIEELGTYRLSTYGLAKFGMFIAIFMLCGFYMQFRRNLLISDFGGLSKLLLLVTFSVGITWIAAPTRFELIPLVLFSMTTAIVYKQELAILFSVCMAFVIVLCREYGVENLVTLVAAMTSTALFLSHVRNRTKLIYVGLWVSLVVFLTVIGVSLVGGEQPDLVLLKNAAWSAGCCAAAGLLMTGLLPFIERAFDVQTDLSLLELGDVAHPLLQELVRRAPGTYNHSINVASIAQAAAEAIDANGQLVRVGAYFHDIGKMLKPQYFVENQTGDNRHESLVPAMSTLVIIAHVKDGADLARQHNLPNSVIDFIQQHHGTTLVEYFYNRANEKEREIDPDAKDVDEGNYRYPGPKPQTKEAAVLMLSDAVESAARSLVDPAPARIESLVQDMAMKRLMDGQFDECGLTLEELHTIQFSLMKSMTAVYHGRIKYPDQQSA